MAKYINLLKNMETLNRLPWAAQSAVFKKLESIADVGGLRAVNDGQIHSVPVN